MMSSSHNCLFHWTYNNHLICGFSQESSGVINKDVFFCKVGSATREIYRAFEESQIAAVLIHKEAKKLGLDIFLCLSGGVDSSAMLSAFMSSGIPFRTIVMRFNDDLNDFDVKWIIQFCNTNHIPCEIFDLNVLDFFESGKYLEYGKRYQCQSPQLAVHLHLCDHIKGCPVLSWQPPEIFYHFNSENKKTEICLGLPGYKHSVFMRYFVENRRFGVPFFFLYTPELLCSFFHLTLLQRLVWFGHKGADVRYSYELKCMSYTHSGFPVKPRKINYTGFEKIREHYDLLDKKSYGLAFNNRYRAPLEKLNPFPKIQHQVVPQDTLFNPKQMQKLDEMYGKELLHSDSDPSLLFKKEMVKLYTNDEIGAFSAPSVGGSEIKNVNLRAFSPSQMELKIWLCQELESILENKKIEKPVSIWIIAGYYNVMGFLLFSRGKILIKKIKNFDIDSEAIEISKSLCSFWQVKGICESFVMDCNLLKYDEEIPDIVINTACEHLKTWGWLESIPKGVIVALQANNIFHKNHPNCFRSLADFKVALEEKKGFSKILFEGVKSFDETSAFQQFMLIGVR